MSMLDMGESNIDTDTFNLSYYSTTPLEDDTKSERYRYWSW